MSSSHRLGDFVLEKEIGRGGMGRVFLARQVSLDRLVAVKVLSADLAEHPEFRARFDKEARAAGALTHPNVVQVYVAGVERGLPYFAMEYCDGENLAKRLAADGRMAPLEALKIAESVVKTLVAAHDNGVIHRDLKPSNIMIDRFGTVKVLDFGLAKLTMDARLASFTRQGAFLGTPAYVSPEQAKGRTIDIRSDIYSVGVVLFEMLVGRPPFEGRTAVEVLKKHIGEAPPAPRAFVKEIPESVERLTLRMMQKDPEERPASPKLLLDEIREIIAELEALALKPPPAPKAQKDEFAPDRTEAVFAPVLAGISAKERAERGKSLVSASSAIELWLGGVAVALTGMVGSLAYWLLYTRF